VLAAAPATAPAVNAADDGSGDDAAAVADDADAVALCLAALRVDPSLFFAIPAAMTAAAATAAATPSELVDVRFAADAAAAAVRSETARAALPRRIGGRGNDDDDGDDENDDDGGIDGNAGDFDENAGDFDDDPDGDFM
jgi:hypothetical protein